MGELLYIVIGGVLWNNIVLTQLLGLFPFFGERPRSVGENGALGLITTVVMVVAVVVAYIVRVALLQPLAVVYLEPVMLVLLLFAILAGLNGVIRVSGTTRVPANLVMRVFLNSAVFGVLLLQLNGGAGGTAAGAAAGATTASGPASMIAATLGYGLGLTVLLVLMEAISARPETRLVPRWVRGMPLQFLTLGLIALAMNGLAGI